MPSLELLTIPLPWYPGSYLLVHRRPPCSPRDPGESDGRHDCRNQDGNTKDLTRPSGPRSLAGSKETGRRGWRPSESVGPGHQTPTSKGLEVRSSSANSRTTPRPRLETGLQKVYTGVDELSDRGRPRDPVVRGQSDRQSFCFGLLPGSLGRRAFPSLTNPSSGPVRAGDRDSNPTSTGRRPRRPEEDPTRTRGTDFPKGTHVLRRKQRKRRGVTHAHPPHPSTGIVASVLPSNCCTTSNGYSDSPATWRRRKDRVPP